MGDFPSFLHRWKKPLFPWGQLMPALCCIFILWGMVMMSGLYPSIPALLAVPNQPIQEGGIQDDKCYPTRLQGHLGCPEENWEAAHGGYLIWASAGQGVYIYIAAGWSFSPLLFFILFFPNRADETHSLFRIRKSLWLPESLSPSEYGVTKGQDPVLFGGCCWDYWPECDTQDVETRESCLTVTWVGVSPAIYCFPKCLLAFTQKNYYILSVKNDPYYT